MSRNLEICQKLYQKLRNIPIKPDEIYYHYRNPNQHYKIITVALDEATEEPSIVYKALYDDELVWVRSYSVWSELVDHNGQNVKRFEKV